MGERKVLNKYYPPDFDPSKIPRRKLGKNRQYKVRLMAPFHMRCLNCGNYIYKATKFNAMKETVEDEEYLGLRIFRFYIRCQRCSAEITFKTDPKNTDYVCEHGATRNFETWRIADKIGTMDDMVAEEEEEKEANPMELLEQRTKESRLELDILEGLEEIKDANARKAKVTVDELLKDKAQEVQQAIRARLEREKLEEDAAVAQVFGENGKIRRVADEPPEDDPAPESFADTESTTSDRPAAKRAKLSAAPKEKSIGTFGMGLSSLRSLIKKKNEETSASSSGTKPSASIVANGNVQQTSPSSASSQTKLAPVKQTSGLAALGDYGSSSDDD